MNQSHQPVPIQEPSIPRENSELVDRDGLLDGRSGIDEETRDQSNLYATSPSTTDDIRRLEQRLHELEQEIKSLAHRRSADSIERSRSRRGLRYYSNSETGSEYGNDAGEDRSDRASERGEVMEPVTHHERHVTPKAEKTSVVGYYNRFADDNVYAVEVMVREYRNAPSDVHLELQEFENLMGGMNHPEGLEILYERRRPPSAPGTFVDRIRINSQPVIELLHGFDPSIPMDDGPLVADSPFAALIEYHDRIREAMESWPENELAEPGDTMVNQSLAISSRQALEEVRAYWEFFDSAIIPVYTRSGASDSKMKVRFLDLPYLFRLGEDLYYPEGERTLSTDSHDYFTTCRLDPNYTFREFNQVDADLRLVCYYIDFDGKFYIPIRREVTIERFDGEREVTSLPIYPARCMPQPSEHMDGPQKQGLRFVNYIAERQMLYQGWALQRGEEKEGLERGYISSSVIIDPGEAFRSVPDWQPEDGGTTATHASAAVVRDSGVSVWERSRNGYVMGRTKPSQWNFVERYLHYLKRSGDDFTHRLGLGDPTKHRKERLDDGELALLPRRLFAYALQDRTFVILDINHVKQPSWIGDPFSDLIIHASQKQMVRSLVHSHFKKREMEQKHGFFGVGQDIINNKGRGLVILLHGVPGVGKSSTAEAVAQKWGNPLLAITCGDLGLEAAAVERSLKEIFRLAQLWDCVLLLDEAEVFLSQRSPADLQRNALVSVFLRVLEYYSGILFLTTNRVGNIDEAFKSRIHVSLYYPPLGEEQTRRIWEMNIERLRKAEKEHSEVTGEPMPTIDKENILKFSDSHYGNSKPQERWNGRQIRNAFLTATALARYEYHDATEKAATGEATGPPKYEIAKRHFEKVAMAGAGFEYYLQQAKGKTDGELAYDHGIRADYLNKPTQPRTHHDQPQDTRRGQQLPDAYNGTYHEVNRDHSPFNSPGYHPGAGPAAQRAESHYGHTNHPGYQPDPYNQGYGTQTQSQWGSGNRNDELGPVLSTGMYAGQLTPSRARTPQPSYSGQRVGPGPSAAFPSPNPYGSNLNDDGFD
ncbi:hypothetical protein BJY01DRAFT_179464 [Aspergillus pseudoustus]|uniref:AAA+ ATPase domain-containing protein n=1 Tax=Aspergillus pseudoustus TaxID=1810923 RepID=A0ABR4KW36_9EURO